MSTVLVVEDDDALRGALCASLHARRLNVLEAGTGEAALQIAARENPDLVLLDLGLPGIDGTQVLRTLREWGETPVVVLTVRDTQIEKVTALDAGATDYVTKPFNTEELLARVRATLRARHPRPHEPRVVRFESLEIDLDRRRVLFEGEPVRLTPMELALLELFVTSRGRLLSHDYLRAQLRAPDDDRQVSLRVHVRHLRQKLGDASAYPRLIGTEPGLGYRWLLDDASGPEG
ncbi:MAG: response regulator transcription factor [Acidimicrobiia bacterium]